MTTSQYAKDTTVPVERSRAEIERTLARYGAAEFMYGWSGTQAVVQFAANGRRIRFVLQLPDRDDPRFTRTPARGTRRTPAQAEQQWEQACRQSWRALALVIKAKLEAVASNISTFEEEFAMWTVLPDGQTAADHVLPAIEEAYATGALPPMLPTYPRALPSGGGS
ncbi:hypothetical protein GCM10027418_06250 [Mariniluteicoccus endophyticus]